MFHKVKSVSPLPDYKLSVGSPDKSSDEYIPLVLKLHRLGSIQITKDTQLDTADDVDMEDDDEGV